MKLPELPKPFTTLPIGSSLTLEGVHVWASDAMEAYGRACYAAGAQEMRERAARECDRLNDAAYTEWEFGGESPDLVDVAAAIRALEIDDEQR